MCELCSAASHLKFHVSDYIKHLQMFHVHQPNLDLEAAKGSILILEHSKITSMVYTVRMFLQRTFW